VGGSAQLAWDRKTFVVYGEPSGDFKRNQWVKEGTGGNLKLTKKFNTLGSSPLLRFGFKERAKMLVGKKGGGGSVNLMCGEKKIVLRRN